MEAMRRMTTNDFWKDKCVLITGASSGIGEALAEHVAARGAKVGLLARRQSALERIVATMRAAKGTAACGAADVADRDALQAAIRQLETQLGPCDVLIANAGIYRKTSGKFFDAAAANDVIATNLTGVVNAVGAVLPGMVERRSGNIAAVASIAALLGLPAAGAYSCSKAAVVMLLRSLRVDVRKSGVRVTTICPGYVDTPLITDEERATLKNLISAPDAARRIARAIEQGRAELWFPWSTWISAHFANWLPFPLYHQAMKFAGEMEETPPRGV